jgi:hypothetical protein
MNLGRAARRRLERFAESRETFGEARQGFPGGRRPPAV